MRTLDQQTIEATGIPGIVLMENAGRTTYQILRQEFPELNDLIVVLAGRGNNGGDGFVVARYLANAGREVIVLLLAEREQVRGEAKINLDILEQLSVPVYEITHEQELREQVPLLQSAGLLVDALLGTGLASEVRGLYRLAIDLLNAMPTPVLAIDIPSGLSADSGQPLGAAVAATVTVTYGWPKLGQILPPGRDLVGRLWQVDISIPPSAAAISSITLPEPAVLRSALPPRRRDSHKGNFGHLLVVAGSVGKTGAATLTGEAALRVGAGLVTVGVPASLNPILEMKLTEAMTLPLAEAEGVQALGRRALEEIAAAVPGKTALAVGPGLGTHHETVALVRELVRRSNLPLVLDADGLNAIAHDVESVSLSQAPMVLTPHPGEMSRLLKCSTKEIQDNRLEVALEVAAKIGAVVVLKGAQSIIADPDGRAMINSTGNPALAQGGSGDVLTGMIGGLLAQRVDPFQAACLAVYLHGLTADVLAASHGNCGILAGELLLELPEVINAFASGNLPKTEEQPCYRLVIS
ncbi:MAG: NAD(P)H-hydrate dehydratase [Desulfobacca sp.]|uniref:NAD(P)H-hydrate dehydratase n=1 Tax=Desulfobacca sp. TaxID=2067990 RepID=UPI004049D075